MIFISANRYVHAQVFNFHSYRTKWFTSLERIDAYLHIEREKHSTQEGVPPAYWPASGDLKVEKLAARYSPDGPKVLDDVSFHVKSGERVGVGKQSKPKKTTSSKN